MKLRRLFNFGERSNGHHRRPELLPFNERHRTFCPRCNSLATLYIPMIAEGHCDECGYSWRFLIDPDAGFQRPRRRRVHIDYADLVGFCVVMQRQHVQTLDEAMRRYDKLGIAEPERATFERAWREATDHNA